MLEQNTQLILGGVFTPDLALLPKVGTSIHLLFLLAMYTVCVGALCVSVTQSIINMPGTFLMYKLSCVMP